MAILFPEATPQQLELCLRHHLPVKPIKAVTHQQEIRFDQATEDALSRVKNRIRVISDKDVSGHVLAVQPILVYRKRVYETPKFKMDALALLKNLQGHAHIIITAWGLKNIKTGKLYTGTAETKVFFRALDDESLTAYVNDHDVVKMIGGYDALQTNAAGFIDKIDGSINNFLYHLPLETILPVIEKEKI